MARLVIIVAYLALVVSGATLSSIGISSLRDNPAASASDQIGSPQPIRSDEWLTGTEIQLGLLADGSSQAYTPLSTSPDLNWQVPARGSVESVVFWDGNLLRLGSILPARNLFAAWYWLPFLLLLLCLPPLLRRLGATPALAWLATVLTIVAPASAWWSFFPIRILGFSAAGCLALLVGAERVRDGRYTRAALLGVAVAVLFSRLGTYYVPWSVTVAIPLILATVAFLVWAPKGRWRVVAYCAGTLAGSLLLYGLLVLFDHTAVQAELKTVYPGLRRATGQVLDPGQLFGAPVLGYLQTGQTPVSTNQSELSSAYTFAAIWAGLLWLAVKRPRWDRSAVPAAVLGLCCTGFLIWCTVNLASFGRALPIMNRLEAGRVAQTLGYPAVMLLALVLGRTEQRVSIRQAAGIAAACGLITAYGGSAVRNVLPYMGSTFIALASLAVAGAVFAVTRWPRSRWVAAAVGALALAQVITVNPLLFGLGDLRGGPAAQRATSMRAQAEQAHGEWVTDSQYADALLLSNGVPLLSGHQVSGPVREEWHRLDPQGRYETQWNRGASYLIFAWTKSPIPVITNPTQDTIQVSVNPCSLPARGFNLVGIVSTVPLSQSCLRPAEPFAFGGAENRVYTISNG